MEEFEESSKSLFSGCFLIGLPLGIPSGISFSDDSFRCSLEGFLQKFPLGILLGFRQQFLLIISQWISQKLVQFVTSNESSRRSSEVQKSEVSFGDSLGLSLRDFFWRFSRFFFRGFCNSSLLRSLQEFPRVILTAVSSVFFP